MNNYQFDIMERCDFMPLTAELASLPFCCGETEGDKDLEDFFHHNALLYAQERLGVNKKYQGRNFLVGQQVMNFIKTWFVQEDNKTGCRFLVVDAYNQPKVLNFYERNKFKYLYATEELERAEQHFPETFPVYTRLMFLDLLHTQILEYPNVIK